MRQERFEELTLHLWMTSRVPLTRANLLFYTGAPRRKVDGWLDVMVREGVLDVDSDDAGEMVWIVRGAARPATGSDRIDDVARLQRLRGEVKGGSSGTGTSLALGQLSRQLGRLDQAGRGREGEKSLVVSGALSFFFPGFGWLYAGSFREVLPALLVMMVVGGILPHLPYFLVWPFAGLLAPLSALIGVLYAVRHNESGHRAPLLLDDNNDDGPRALPGRR